MKVGRKQKSGQIFRFRPEQETLNILNQINLGKRTKFVEDAILEKFTKYKDILKQNNE